MSLGLICSALVNESPLNNSLWDSAGLYRGQDLERLAIDMASDEVKKRFQPLDSCVPGLRVCAVDHRNFAKSS